MRNLLLFFSLFMNVLFLFIACTKNETTERPGAAATAADNTARSTAAGSAALAASACRSPRPQMTYGMVAQMVNNYRSNQWTASSSAIGTSDARAACFDLDSLENFICHLKTMSAAAGCSSLNNLGIRFYYAAYSSPAEAGVSSSYSRKHTLIMIPTYRNAQGYDVDFDPSKIDSITCLPIPLSRVHPSTPLNNGVILNNNLASGGGGGNVFGMDHPVLSPPPVQGMGF